MGLKTMSLLADASISVSGGTALAFAEDGVAIAGGVHLIVPSDSNYKTRRMVTAKSRPPSYDAKTATWSKDKKSISLVLPIVLADGRTVFNTVRVEREVHPDLAAADAAELNKLAAQLLADADTADFWATGSLS